MLDTLSNIGLGLGAMTVFGIGLFIFGILREIYFSFRYENYNRDPSEGELRFLDSAAEDFMALGEKRDQQGQIYVIIAALCLIVISAGWLTYKTYMWALECASPIHAAQGDVLIAFSPDFGFGGVLLIFSSLIASFLLVQAFIMLRPDLEIRMAMQCDMYGMGFGDVMSRKADRLIFDVRRGKVSVQKPFSARDYIIRDSRRPYKGVMMLFLVVLGSGLAFTYFDMRRGHMLTSTHIHYPSQAYINLDPGYVRSWADVDSVELQCKPDYETGRASAEYSFYDGSKRLATYFLYGGSLDALYQTDAILREKGTIFRTGDMYDPQLIANLHGCLVSVAQSRGIAAEHFEKLKTVMHVERQSL